MSSALPAISALVLAGCATARTPVNEAVAAPAAAVRPAPADGSVTVFDGGCFYAVSCITYEMTLRADGGYELMSQSGARTPGASQGNLGPEAFAALEAVLAAADFAALPATMNGSNLKDWNPEIPMCFPHAAGLRITRRAPDGSQKTIAWDAGCPSERMSALRSQVRAALRYDDLVAPAR